MNLENELQRLAGATDFSGAVSVWRDGESLIRSSWGHADRRHRRPNRIDTQFATASVAKGATALAVGSMIEAGRLGFDTSAKSVLGDALPNLNPAVTVEQLLAHTSGVGDYLDEEVPSGDDDYDLDCPVHSLNSPRDYLSLVDLPQESAPGSVFRYNNSGYVILSALLEVASGQSFYDVVHHAVLEKAGMTDSGFFRSDDLPSRAALGYLTDGRTNILHLPVRGAGDGGLYSTVDDLEKLWLALREGRILSPDFLQLFMQPRNRDTGESLRYGMGFWVRADRPTIMLEGCDRGVSARSVYDPESALVYSVLANTMNGAWPIAKFLDSNLDQLQDLPRLGD